MARHPADDHVQLVRGRPTNYYKLPYTNIVHVLFLVLRILVGKSQNDADVLASVPVLVRPQLS